MGFILAGAHATIRHIAGRIYLSERNKTDKGFIEKANDVGAAQTCPRGNGEWKLFHSP